jgi:hypothetical protein
MCTRVRMSPEVGFEWIGKRVIDSSSSVRTPVHMMCLGNHQTREEESEGRRVDLGVHPCATGKPKRTQMESLGVA